MDIAVIAGTPFDTKLGQEFLKKYGYDSEGYPISNTPDEQSILQVLYPDELNNMVKEKIKIIKKREIKNIFVYCNSLSAAVDMEKLSKEFHVNIITPLQVYVDMGREFNIIGVLAANNQSAFGIEKVIQKWNPQAHIIGIGALPIVNAIERNLESKEIVEKLGLDKAMEFFKHINCEVVILGCTHFPYFYEELKKKSSIPIIDPAVKMLEKLII
ncbi:aspartate/glutamate racemase family protein [uncultured Clostridium sp.]|uniref:aspartate/glutamate racemase family protein n=1 Tax=uncultured Clostridium sp. TaxID=59620 RepID=UPI0028EC4CA3|nr:aspartate/glutamate racemase family protein [uncultured Clostridium sp.]